MITTVKIILVQDAGITITFLKNIVSMNTVMNVLMKSKILVPGVEDMNSTFMEGSARHVRRRKIGKKKIYLAAHP